jgi:hypothetical protein
MARAVALVCACICAGFCVACSGNPYVIGRVSDAGEVGQTDAESGVGAALGECAEVHQKALLCSGFEKPELSAEWSYQDHTRDGVVERSVERAHSGVGSLRASSAGPSNYALVAADFPALRGGELHLRSYVYVPADQPTQIMNVMFVGDGDHGVDFNLDDGAAQLYSPQSPQRYTDTRSIPRDRWFCLRLQLSIDDVRGAMRVFIDERMALQTGPFDTLPEDGVNELRLGIDWSSEQEPLFEIYFDDVVADTAPVSCMD